MKHCWCIALLCLALGAGARPRAAAAQVTAADTAAVLYQVAEQLVAAGDRVLAQQLLRLILRQYPGTPVAAEVERRLAELHGRDEETSGRVELTVWGTIYGAWLGLAVPLALGAEDPEPYGAGLLLAAPTGLFAARAFGRSGPMSLGQARIIRWGSIWGTWQGIGWREVLDIGDEQFCDPTFGCSSFDSDLAPFTAAVLGGLTGIGVSAAIARTRNISAGSAAVVELSSIWGTWLGVSSGIVLNLDENEDGLLSHTLLAGNLALVTAALIAPGIDMSVGRARLISVSGLGGAIIGLGLDLLSDVEDEGLAFGIPMVTSLTGLIAGAAWTRNHDRAGSREGAPGAALLNIRNGRLTLGTPMPMPTVFRGSPRGDPRGWTPGVRLSLLEARF